MALGAKVDSSPECDACYRETEEASEYRRVLEFRNVQTLASRVIGLKSMTIMRRLPRRNRASAANISTPLSESHLRFC